MSGGRFDYLCFAEPDQMFEKLPDVKAMAKALTESGAHGAAAETEAVVAYIEHAERQISARKARLNNVWHAMEWWKSGDWSEDQFREAVAGYDEA